MAKNTETERKFLVTSDAFKTQAVQSYAIEQGYLSKYAKRTIRVRIRDARAFLTIKSSTLREGIAKFEWEREIDIDDARELLKICLPGIISKTRYIIPAPSYKGETRKWEVDVFHSGKKKGEVLAEIELGDENEPFEKPEWLGEEVTGQPEYYNANM
ncbi:MAG: CYTH domain-containing protein [Paludibacteraceae bacterium]|nr:CYTH domain-containing protein [Paludibacteraceae bacterium]